jgi:hypothetical protein
MIVHLTDAEKGSYRIRWRPLASEVETNGCWAPVAAHWGQTMAITAWDPFGIPFKREENLRLAKKRLSLISHERPVRTRRRMGWVIDSLLVPYNADSLRLVRQCHQLASFVWIDAFRHLLWNDGTIEAFP